MVAEVAGGLGLAQRLLQLAEKEGATEAEALVLGGSEQLTRFANSEIHQNVAEDNRTISLRFVIGRQVGVASTNRSDDESLRRLARSAGDIARLQPEREDFAGLPGPTEVALVAGAYAAATATASPEDRAAGARAVIGAADDAGVLGFGSYKTVTERVAVANSRGVAVEEERTHAHLITVSMGADGEAGYAEAAAVDLGQIDAAAVGREAAGKARASRNPQQVEPGEYPVVLEEYAVVDLLDMLGYLGFSALAVQEGRSFFESGRKVGSELVSIWDDATDPAGMPASFDWEGVAKQKVSLLDRGVCVDVVHDAQTAATEGRRSTGHGLPAPNPWGPFPLNQMMAAGVTSREDLIGGLDRGLLVTRFHYTNPVHPKLAIVTGMTRDGLFLVEGGEVRGPVRNLRFTQSYLDALAGVEAVGSSRRLLRGFLGAVLVPAVRISAFTFTGATEH
ncbi:MAG TPA: TldD/PmbA family protein [Candidatus Limnocylindrales bacterium]|nr:TldD/PmbA family protein [Candidatus Limnocylindrales bacterium]